MWIVNTVLCVLVLYTWEVVCVKTITSITIGGIFYDDNQASAFQQALKKRTSENLRFEAAKITPSSPDIYTTLKEVCRSTSSNDYTRRSSAGWAALVDAGETSGTCNALCHLCDSVNIPQLLTTWRPPEPSSSSKPPFGLAYHPQPALISRAYARIIKYMQWQTFTMLYEDGNGLIRMQEIIKSRPPMAKPVIFRRMDPYGDNKSLFKTMLDENNFVVDCDAGNIIKYLDEISAVNNHTMYQSYIFTSLDAHTLDLRRASKFEANVSTLHMTDRDDHFWLESNIDGKTVKLQTALAVDAATHVTVAIENTMRKRRPYFTQPPPMCQRSGKDYGPWKNGTTILDELRKTKAFPGLSGNIDFGNSSYRQNIILKYSVNMKNGFVQNGFWNSSTDVLTILVPNNDHEQYESSNSTKKIRVVSRDGKPYFGVNNETGAFEGFAVDLIEKVFEHINKHQTDGSRYEYEFYKAKNNGYAEMIDDLKSHNADLAICDLTMTSERQEVVDFSAPFMSLGISILFMKPHKEDPNKFSFLEPLALDLWLYLGTAYLFVSFVLLICARMSQQDWVNPHPCNRNPEALENIWTLYNCTWLSMGTIMTQGCDILPRAPGSRWVTGMWWFFTLIITASYTANVSSFISNTRRDNDISNAKELAEQNKIQYGTVFGQSTYKFFKNSNDSVYKKIFSTMESTRPSVYTVDNNQGRERVLKGKNKYAFFMESTSIEYYIQRNCDMRMVGGRLDSKDYGIAMPKRSPLRTKIDSAILKLQEDAVIEEIKKKWWEEKDNTEKCKNKDGDGEGDDEGNGSLQMNNTSGIFLVLLAGGVLGFIFASSDFLLHSHKIATVENITWQEALRSEWRSSLNPRLLSKPVALPRDDSTPSEHTPSFRQRSMSRAVSVLKAAQSFINLNDVY